MQSIPESGFRFYDLEGRTLIITGVTRGIGRALLKGFLGQGMVLVLVSRGLERLHGIHAELHTDPDHLRLIECDLSKPEAVKRAASEIAGLGLPIDAILHNAAIDPRHRFDDGSDAPWRDVFQVNLHAAIKLTQCMMASLSRSEQGRIIFTGSVMCDLGGARLSAYAASKGALLGLTRSLAHELKGTNITVNCIVPGAISVEKVAETPELIAQVLAWQSVPRLLIPQDLLGIMCLLLSRAGGAITGQAITVDGGLLHPMADANLQDTVLLKPAK